MKRMTESLINKICRSQHSFNPTSVKWDEIYDSEAELIRDMQSAKLILNGTSPRVCKGYAYIEGFRRYYEKNGKLTDKQMTQLKRLASSIAYSIYCK